MTKMSVHNVCNLRYKFTKETPIVLHSESNYDYYLIITNLADEFKVKLECLGESFQYC